MDASVFAVDDKLGRLFSISINPSTRDSLSQQYWTFIHDVASNLSRSASEKSAERKQSIKLLVQHLSESPLLDADVKGLTAALKLSEALSYSDAREVLPPILEIISGNGVHSNMDLCATLFNLMSNKMCVLADLDVIEAYVSEAFAVMQRSPSYFCRHSAEQFLRAVVAAGVPEHSKKIFDWLKNQWKDIVLEDRLDEGAKMVYSLLADFCERGHASELTGSLGSESVMCHLLKMPIYSGSEWEKAIHVMRLSKKDICQCLVQEIASRLHPAGLSYQYHSGETEKMDDSPSPHSAEVEPMVADVAPLHRPRAAESASAPELQEGCGFERIKCVSSPLLPTGNDSTPNRTQSALLQSLQLNKSKDLQKLVGMLIHLSKESGSALEVTLQVLAACGWDAETSEVSVQNSLAAMEAEMSECCGEGMAALRPLFIPKGHRVTATHCPLGCEEAIRSQLRNHRTIPAMILKDALSEMDLSKLEKCQVIGIFESVVSSKAVENICVCKTAMKLLGRALQELERRRVCTESFVNRVVLMAMHRLTKESRMQTDGDLDSSSEPGSQDFFVPMLQKRDEEIELAEIWLECLTDFALDLRTEDQSGWRHGGKTAEWCLTWILTHYQPPKLALHYEMMTKLIENAALGGDIVHFVIAAVESLDRQLTSGTTLSSDDALALLRMLLALLRKGKLAWLIASILNLLCQVLTHDGLEERQLCLALWREVIRDILHLPLAADRPFLGAGVNRPEPTPSKPEGRGGRSEGAEWQSSCPRAEEHADSASCADKECTKLSLLVYSRCCEALIRALRDEDEGIRNEAKALLQEVRDRLAPGRPRVSVGNCRNLDSLLADYVTLLKTPGEGPQADFKEEQAGEPCSMAPVFREILNCGFDEDIAKPVVHSAPPPRKDSHVNVVPISVRSTLQDGSSTDVIQRLRGESDISAQIMDQLELHSTAIVPTFLAPEENVAGMQALFLQILSAVDGQQNLPASPDHAEPDVEEMLDDMLLELEDWEGKPVPDCP